MRSWRVVPRSRRGRGGWLILARRSILVGRCCGIVRLRRWGLGWGRGGNTSSWMKVRGGR